MCVSVCVFVCVCVYVCVCVRGGGSDMGKKMSNHEKKLCNFKYLWIPKVAKFILLNYNNLY